jgi:hypothetical protein
LRVEQKLLGLAYHIASLLPGTIEPLPQNNDLCNVGSRILVVWRLLL